MKIKRFPLGTLWTNCYIIWDDKGDGFIVDPGGPAQEADDFIRSHDIKLHWILLTHGHSDHIGGVADLRNLSENGVAIHAEDADCLSDPDKNLSSYIGSTTEVSSADRILHDGDELKIGTMTVKVIHTPGHTLGGVCFLVTDTANGEEMLISGDTLFARSVGRSDLPGGDEQTLIESLKKLNGLPDDMRVFPGHGPETTIGTEKRYNPYWPK